MSARQPEFSDVHVVVGRCGPKKSSWLTDLLTSCYTAYQSFAMALLATQDQIVRFGELPSVLVQFMGDAFTLHSAVILESHHFFLFSHAFVCIFKLRMSYY